MGGCVRSDYDGSGPADAGEGSDEPGQRINTLKQQVATLQQNMENAFNYLEENIKKERLRPAFHVTFNATTQTNVGDHEVLKFDTVVLNYGSGYNSSTGKFTAPVTGIYELSVHFEEAQGQYVYVNLMTEDGKVSYSVSGDPQWQSSSAFTSLVYMTQGKTAWVERDAGTASYVLNYERSEIVLHWVAGAGRLSQEQTK